MMSSSEKLGLPEKQKGIILLIMTIIIILASVSYLLSEFSVTEIKQQHQQITQNALKQAKQALLAFTMTRANLVSLVSSKQPGMYGYFPCPAINNTIEGISDGSCGMRFRNTLGWFPWKSLDMPPLKDGNGDCLLYAVSSSYKFSPNAGMLNEDSFGMLQVDDGNGTVIQGGVAKDRVVAIVFSAGQALAGQHRVKDPNTECGYDKNNFSAYMDAYTLPSGTVINNSKMSNLVDRVDRFIQIASMRKKNVVNDQMLMITRDEIWPLIMRRAAFNDTNLTDTNKMRRLTEALAKCMAAYANNNDTRRLPFPAPLNFKGGDYRNNSNYVDNAISHLGHYPFTTAVADSIIPGTMANKNLFEKKLKSGVFMCEHLTLAFPGGATADLKDITAQARQMWNNWKDHIFYAVSADYAASSSKTKVTGCGNCIQVSGIKYAAVVMYSGQKLAGQIREAPVANIDTGVLDTKQILNNYIEVVNPAGNGQGDYTSVPTSNDTMFCLTASDPVSVKLCR